MAPKKTELRKKIEHWLFGEGYNGWEELSGPGPSMFMREFQLAPQDMQGLPEIQQDIRAMFSQRPFGIPEGKVVFGFIFNERKLSVMLMDDDFLKFKYKMEPNTAGKLAGWRGIN